MRFELLPSLLAVFLLADVSSAQQSSPKPQQPQQTAPVPPAVADDNPFPEDVSRKAAESTKQQQSAKPEAPANSAPVMPEAPATGESSSNTGYKPAEDDAEPAPANPERRKLRLDGESAIGTPHADRLALKDEDIADLYFKDGNYEGALLRYQDALRLVPDDETAALGIAESARKLHKRDRALEAYKTYLKLAPQGKKANEARKAIEELSVAAKH